jgi:uncharacterized protein
MRIGIGNRKNFVPKKWRREMKIPREAVLLRIFFGENDKFDRRPLHEAIVLKAREMHLGGATVLRGHIGFGHSSRIHASRFLRLSQDLPVVVEIVDSQEKIDGFLPVLDGMMSSGLITMERAEVLQYGTEETRPLQGVRPASATSDNLKV